MNLKRLNFFYFIITVLLLQSCAIKKVSTENAKELTLQEQILKEFPSAKIKALDIASDSHFTEKYEVYISQPLSHENPKEGTLEQRIIVSHADYNKPTLLETSGYWIYDKDRELAKITKGNQIVVEYRYYGKSRPENPNWKYLHNAEAIEDYHRIVTKFKNIYKGKWIASGVSKGGENTLIYRTKYPKDIDVYVPYVAPLIHTTSDKRTDDHINTVGTEECREKVKNFQRMLLEEPMRETLISKSRDYVQNKNWTFNTMSLEEAFEYAVLEYSFSFWQWSTDCESIPTSTNNVDEVFNHLMKVSGLYFYSDQGADAYLPSNYEHQTVYGYYKLDTSPVKDLLQYAHDPSFMNFIPEEIPVSYDPNYIKKVRNYIEKKGDRVIYIYGEFDTWYACAPNPKKNVDYLMMVLKGAHHGTRIKDFTKEDQDKIYAKLKEWLGDEVAIYPLYN
ncbi:S28 family serine protease [Aureivirga sp. CE67]|uniref:S28 family serine protease n=1 Tax=Aureivirga sp. CE67 TaxID=1788983 RepID=UPI0018CB3397|nr:S28 family serine protease [Aureivirga sp. CE67]